jgi:hypothetical protein
MGEATIYIDNVWIAMNGKRQLSFWLPSTHGLIIVGIQAKGTASEGQGLERDEDL